MDVSHSALTVFFEESFWVGLFERTENGRLTVCRVVFGPEPREPELLAFVQQKYIRLCFSPAVEAARSTAAANPKRIQRQITRQLQQPALSTKAQAALKLQQEQGKLARRERARAERQADARRRFEQKQQKKREKHRGH